MMFNMQENTDFYKFFDFETVRFSFVIKEFECLVNKCKVLYVIRTFEYMSGIYLIDIYEFEKIFQFNTHSLCSFSLFHLDKRREQNQKDIKFLIKNYENIKDVIIQDNYMYILEVFNIVVTIILQYLYMMLQNIKYYRLIRIRGDTTIT